jgi:hypothetical protein
MACSLTEYLLARSLASSFSVAATSRFNIAVGMQKGNKTSPREYVLWRLLNPQLANFGPF